MKGKEEEVSEVMEGFKGVLSVKDRIEVIATAKELLEVQRGNEGFIEIVKIPSLYEDGKNI